MTFAEVTIERMTGLIETANKDSAWEMEAAAEMTKAIHLLSIPAQGAVDWPMEVDRLNDMIVRYEAEIERLRSLVRAQEVQLPQRALLLIQQLAWYYELNDCGERHEDDALEVSLLDLRAAKDIAAEL